MDERENARAEIGYSRDRMKAIATELVSRTKPTYVKQKAKEAAVQKTIETKNRIVHSPTALGIIGGVATAVIARRVLARQDRKIESRYAETWTEDDLQESGTGTVENVKARAHEKLDDMKQAAGDLKDRAVRQVQGVRERIPSRQAMSAKAHDVRMRATDYAQREPLVTALGALALGAALGFLLPVGNRERRMLAPAREQVAQRIDTLTSDVSAKLDDKVDELRDKIAGDTDPMGGDGFDLTH
ncbi:MAG TPA: hypothetical protein VM261_38390 [Kofleriaceae bacterium]|nr:hypothetical protein [Kofleriaceae bacterium]